MSYDNGVLRLMLLGCMLAAVGCAAQTVEGNVVDSATGVSIPGVSVRLVRAGNLFYSATTDSHGHFRIEAVEPGIYSAHYTARGFWSIPNFLVDEDFERVCGQCFLAERGGQPFPVAGGDPVRLEVKMAPLGKISGRVLDPDGKPVPNAILQLQWGENWICKMPSCIGISRQAKADEKGEYRITDLEVPGAWLLSALVSSSSRPPESSDDRRLAWAQTFYPGVTDPQLSVRVMLRPGAEISNLDIKLATVAVHHVRGVVVDTAGNPVPDATVTLRKRVTSPIHVRNTQVDGTFDFEAVAEGEWRVSAKMDRERARLWTADWVQVKLHDLESLKLRLEGPFAMQGKIVMEAPEGTPPPKPPHLTLAFNPGDAVPVDNPGGAFLAGAPDDNGNFQIDNVYPGSYQVLLGPPPPRYYLDSIRIGGYDAVGSAVPMVPGAQPLTVVYKLGGGTVRGKVENCALGTVRLLPHDKALRRPGFLWFAPCDSNDRYEITAVRPGEYSVIAIAGNNPVPWYATQWDDEALITSSARITIRAGENSSADVRAIRQ